MMISQKVAQRHCERSSLLPQRLSSLLSKTIIAQDIHPGRKNRWGHLSLLDETVQHEHLCGINMPDHYDFFLVLLSELFNKHFAELAG